MDYMYAMEALGQWFSKYSFSDSSTAWESVEMQMFEPHIRPTESVMSGGVGGVQQCVLKSSSGVSDAV